MYIQQTIGELLYIGFVAEKGRCSKRIWGYRYRKTLEMHLSILLELTDVLLDKSDVNVIINKFDKICKSNSEIGKFYNYSLDIGNILWEDKNTDFCKIDQLMKNILNELNDELKGFRVNKRRVYALLRSIHNLPRVYLSESDDTLCNLKLPSISENDALMYSYQNMEEMDRKKYEKFF